MPRWIVVVGLYLALASAACNGADADGPSVAAEAVAIAVTTAVAVTRTVPDFISVSGTLTAEDDADVAAEVSGRIVSTPAERGARVEVGAELIRVSAADAEAQATEAQANAAQIEARLGIVGGAAFDVEGVPEVANARASQELARGDFERAENLHRRLLISQSDMEQRSAQKMAAERQYDVARNTAAQQYQSLIAARARAAMAQKALADTVVRAPFTGVVGERFVSIGDYVNRGTRVASMLRIDPLRVQLTVTEQDVTAVAIGRAVTFDVDAYPHESFTGKVRYVSPSVTADTRALIVEAVVPNQTGRLRPGFFVTARIEQQAQTPKVLVPAAALRTIDGTPRVFVIDGDRAEERIVTTGQAAEAGVEVVTGLAAGERVAVSAVNQLIDGVRVVVR